MMTKVYNFFFHIRHHFPSQQWFDERQTTSISSCIVVQGGRYSISCTLETTTQATTKTWPMGLGFSEHTQSLTFQQPITTWQSSRNACRCYFLINCFLVLYSKTQPVTLFLFEEIYYLISNKLAQKMVASLMLISQSTLLAQFLTYMMFLFL